MSYPHLYHPDTRLFIYVQSSYVSVIRKRIKLIQRRNVRGREAQTLAYKKELEALELLRYLRHPNIIELLASYEFNDEYYLLFPVLSMDLSAFLQSEDRYAEFAHNRTFYTALSQLSSAIEAIHRLSLFEEDLLIEKIGYHHDIRPKNILVTESTFVLTDFGLARFKMPEEGSETLWKETIGDYIAPECMSEDYTRLDVGRAIDIWSLGCLLTEVAAYMELGPQGVKDFAEYRRKTKAPLMIGNACFFEEDGLRETADQWLVRLTVAPSDRGIRSLVAVARNLLQVKVGLRPEASQVTSSLAYIRMAIRYREVEKLLSQLILRLQNIHAFDQVTLQFHQDLFTAWGEFFGMRTEGHTHALFSHRQDASAMCAPLIDLEEFLNEQTESTYDPEAMVETLIAHLRKLWSSVPSQYRSRMEQIWRQKTLLTEDVDVLEIFEYEAKKFHSVLPDVGTHAALRRLTVELERQELSHSYHRKFLLNSLRIHREGTLSHTHEIGTLDQRLQSSIDEPSGPDSIPILLEWAMYSPTWAAQTDEEKVLKLLSLAELLSLQKPTSFHVLDCIGILPPSPELCHAGFAFVYAFPQKYTNAPVSLATLLRKQNYQVLLESKFQIARILASSLLELHSSAPGWLHKDISATNILFFPSSPAYTSSGDMSSPYLVGFQHSRPNGEIWFSDIDRFEAGTGYRDPLYTPGTTRFCPEFDYYSLGILLLEIGFWQPIEAFQSQHRELDAEGFRKVLVKKYLPKLGPKMGSAYRNVVRACLEDLRQAHVPEESGSIEVQNRFFWDVVEPLLEVNLSSNPT
jgi:serine/threonine protein kinase